MRSTEGEDGLPRRGLTGAERLAQLEHRIKRGVHLGGVTFPDQLEVGRNTQEKFTASELSPRGVTLCQEFGAGARNPRRA